MHAVLHEVHLQVFNSRPDAHAVFTNVVTAHRQAAEISVFVAGKRP